MSATEQLVPSGGWAYVAPPIPDVESPCPATRKQAQYDARSWISNLAHEGLLDGRLGAILLALNYRVVIIAGASRSGKSSIRRGLQRALTERAKWLKKRQIVASVHDPYRKILTLPWLTVDRVGQLADKGGETKDRIAWSADHLQSLVNADAKSGHKKIALNTCLSYGWYTLLARPIDGLAPEYSLEWVLRSGALVIADVFPEVAIALKRTLLPAAQIIWIRQDELPLARNNVPHQVKEWRRAHRWVCDQLLDDYLVAGKPDRCTNAIYRPMTFTQSELGSDLRRYRDRLVGDAGTNVIEVFQEMGGWPVGNVETNRAFWDYDGRREAFRSYAWRWLINNRNERVKPKLEPLKRFETLPKWSLSCPGKRSYLLPGS